MKADAAAHQERAGEMCQKKVVVNVGPGHCSLLPFSAQPQPFRPSHHSSYRISPLRTSKMLKLSFHGFST